ncbi:glycosyltransferase family 2 protein [Rhodopseudomonas palustris]
MQVRTALQINLHPLDERHAVHTLPHQLEVWGGQVDRVVLTVDTKQSASGRYGGDAYEDSRGRLFGLLETIANQASNVEIVEVDYAPAALEAVRQRYFASSAAHPEKAFDGGPFHAYFYGLLRSRADYVVHMDSDMLFGGGSQAWLDEAIGWLQRTPDALFAGPLPGPPRADGTLPDLHRSFPGLACVEPPQRLEADYPAYRFESVSTRIFVLDQGRFDAAVGALDLVRPNFKRRLRARLFHQSPLSMPAEEVITAAMMRKRLARIDFLGSGAGMYSLHPPFRSEKFYRELPNLIGRIVAGAIPDAQRGDYDINSSLFDWSEALRQKTKARRLVRAARALLPS